MNTKAILVTQCESLFNQILGSQIHEESHERRDLHELSVKYVQTVFTIENEQKLIAVTGKGDIPANLIRFDLMAATGLIASLIGGIAGVSNPLLIGSIVISSIIAVANLTEKVSSSAALLFWVVYNSDSHEIERDDAKVRFETLAMNYAEVTPEDFHAALQSLLTLNVLEQRHNLLKVKEKLILVRLTD